MSKKKDKKILLLVPTTNNVGEEGFEDREGGESQSLRKIREFFLGSEELDVDKLTKSLDDCLDKLEGVFKKLKTKVVNDWEVDGISVSLGISAEGSIGVVTAGLEGSIEVSFKNTK